MISRWLVQKESKKLLKQISRINGGHGLSQKLTPLYRAYRSLVTEVYGEKSDLLQLVSPFSLSKESLRKGVLEFVSSVKAAGLPFGYRAPNRHMLASAVLSFLVGLAIPVIVFWVKGSTEGRQIRMRQEAEAAITLTTFYSWIEEYDAECTRQFDSLHNNVIAKFGSSSGAIVSPMSAFLTKKRMRRDNVIDSFLVVYAGQGGDTEKLIYSRRLPINVFAGLCKKFPQSEGALRNLGLDTL